MQEIKKVVILGAGAMGAYFASCFFDSQGFETGIVARGERYDRLSRDGLVVNGKKYSIPVIHPDKVDGPADLIIVALKHRFLEEALPDLRNLVGDETVFISVMNGLDSEEIIGTAYGPEKVLYAVSVGIDALHSGNRVDYSKPGKHYFGEAVNDRISPRVKLIQEAFDRAGITHETPRDMIRIMWWKFMINVGVNTASAVMRAPYGVFQTSKEARWLMETLMREVIALARAARVDLTEKDVEDWYTFLNTLSPKGKTSMLQDIESGSKTEVEIFSQKAVELGETYGVPTPANQTVWRIIRVLEQYPGE